MAIIASYDVRLAGIETRSIYLAKKPKDFTGKVFNFDLSADMEVDPKKSLVVTHININVRESEKTEILGNVLMTYFFELKDFSNNIKLNPDKQYYVLPEDLEFQLRIISLSTTRGVMHSNFKGTYLAGATLPIISSPNSDQEIE